MRYAMLIYGNEAAYAQLPNEEQQADFAAYFAFGEEAKELIQGGEALESINTATSVRVRDGKIVTTDGPFAETKEQLGGFYILDCKDLDQAIEYAAKIPGAKLGTVEVRPIMEFD